MRSIRKSLHAAAFACTAALFSVGVASADTFNTPVQWTGAGSNGHFYERVDVPRIGAGIQTWQEASAAAASLTFNGMTGHLAAFEGDLASYQAEFNFVNANVMYPSGNAASDNVAYWVGASSPQATHDDINDWTWITGPSVPSTVAATWNIDDNEGQTFEGATFFQHNSNQLWDYIATDSTNLAGGYVVEFEPAAVPTPSSLGAGAALLLLMGFLRRRTTAALA